MAILCRDIGLLLLQAPHTGSTSLGTLLREELGGKTVVLVMCGSNIDWATFEAQAELDA